MDEAVSRLGVAVERIDFPYRLAGRRWPDRPKILIDTVGSAARSLADRVGAPTPTDGAGTATDSIVLGGRSMGGRMCSLAVAAGLAAAGLVLVSYPLHPPGRPTSLRTEHFPLLDVPCLFVSGRRDAFGAPAELEAATAAISGPVTHVWVDGDHSLKGVDVEVASIVSEWIQTLMS